MIPRPATPLRRQNQHGWVATWLLVLLPVLLALLGVVLDGGILMLRSQMLDAATDAAALAATDAWDRDHWMWHGRVRIDPDGARRLAGQYLAKNLPAARLTDLKVDPSNRVRITTEMEVPLFFMRIAGWENQTLRSSGSAVRRNLSR